MTHIKRQSLLVLAALLLAFPLAGHAEDGKKSEVWLPSLRLLKNRRKPPPPRRHRTTPHRILPWWTGMGMNGSCQNLRASL